MKNYEHEILNRLVDKYESSVTFIGTNVIDQSFSITMAREFPEYGNDANVKEIQGIDEAVNSLNKKGLIIPRHRKNGILYAAQLNKKNLNDCYTFLKRKPKKDLNEELLTVLRKYCTGNDIVSLFCQKQIERISLNKKPEHFGGTIRDYENILLCLQEVTKVQQETFERDFSIRVFGDSKVFNNYKSSIESILFEYGDFPEKETIFEDLNIVKNPGHVFFKGDGSIKIAGQIVDLSALKGDIAISSTLLKTIDTICVSGKAVVTIENLTTFNAYVPNNEFVIYLGGYHNSIRREFIKKLYADNPTVDYYHYGDIDAGGFYILQHLRNKTGVSFMPLHMDIDTLIANQKYTKKLTENDIKRLKNLLGNEFDDVINFMIEHNCKLEQEALD